jgi:type III secretion protein J
MFRRFLWLCAPALAALVLAGCSTQLYADLTEKDANLILATLREANIPANKQPGVEGTYIVMVDETHFARAMEILDEKSLPRRKYDDLGSVFAKGGMFSTPLEEKARYLYATQEELSQTLSAIDGVLLARVHLVLPEQDQLGRVVQKPSAAVFVKYIDDPRYDTTAYQRDIRRLVAASVPNMEEERIAVTFFPTTMKVRDASAAPALVPVWNLQVSPLSASILRIYIATAVGVIILLFAALIALWWRGKVKPKLAKKPVAAAERDDGDPEADDEGKNGGEN